MLVNHKLDALDFDRFPAVQPPKGDEYLKRGLTSSGQLGLWMSFARLFQMIGAEGGDGYVLVAEDDSIMSPALPSILDRLCQTLVSRNSSLDIVFLSYFLTSDLLSAFASAGFTLPSKNHYLLSSSRFYLACTDCFLLSRPASVYLGQLLQRVLDSGVKLPPIDIALRGFIRQGIVNSCIVFPPVSATLLDSSSTINKDKSFALSSSQAAHSVLRAVVACIITPERGIRLLTNIFGVPPQVSGNTMQDFLRYFEVLSHDMAKW